MKTKSKNLLLYVISILLIVTIVSATVTAFASDEKSKPIETITEPQKNDGEQVEEVQGEVKESEKVEQSQVDAQALEADKEEDKKTDVSSNSKIANASPRARVSQFTVDSPSGAKIRYTVLAEDATQQTGTVSIGWPASTGPETSSRNGNGLGSKLTNTDLVLSDTVNYNGYTYTVTELGDYSLSEIGITSIILPSTLKKIGNQALDDNGSCKILKIPEGVTYIGTGQFRGCTSLEVLYLPSTINTLGTQLFGENTNLRTIFFPVSNTITVDKSAGGNNVPFYGLSTGVVIVCENQELYNKWVTDTTIFKLPSSVLTYEMEMEFYDQNGTKLIVDKEVKRLYNMPLSWEKQADGSYLNKFISLTNLGTITDLPVLPNEASLGYKANYWGLNELGITTVDAIGKIEISNTQTGDNQGSLGITHVTSNKMFAFPDKFEISFNPVNKKVYDGEYDVKTSFNRNNVENLLKSGSPVKFYFRIVEKKYANSDSQSHSSGWYFRNNNIPTGLRNVADSDNYVVEYTYMDTRVTTSDYLWLTPRFNKPEAVPLTIDITPADINFTLSIDDMIWSNQTSLPDITLSYDEDGIDGKIVWDQGQTPRKGTHSYSYTFVPSNVSAKKATDKTTAALVNNFTSTSKQGSIDITYKEILKYIVTFKDTNGNILREETVEENNSATAPTAPTLEGYDFIGWDKEFSSITSNTTVTAQYKIQSFLVLYLDYNGNVLKKEMVDYGQTIQAPSAPTREGYTFKNWDEATDKVTKNLVVMPIYEINKYEIQFIDYDGVILKQELVNYGGMILPPNNPIREGYKFTGWDKSFSHITASMKIKAEYEKIEISKPTISEPKENIEIPAYKKLKPEVLGQNNKRLTQNNEGPNQNIEVDLRQEPITNEKTNIVEDKAVGTKIETVNKDMVFDPNLKVSVVAANKEESLKATQELDNVVKVFDVILEQDGIRVEKTLDSKIRIYIDAKEFEKYKDMKMYQQTSNGQYVELPMKVENGQIIFECDALDTYVLTGIESQDEFPWWIIVVGAVTIVGIIIIVKKRKSEDKDI